MKTIAYVIEPDNGYVNYDYKTLADSLRDIFKNTLDIEKHTKLFLVQNYEDKLPDKYDYVIYTDTRHFQFLKEDYNLNNIFYLKFMNDITKEYYLWKKKLETIFCQIHSDLDYEPELNVQYPKTRAEIKEALNSLLNEPFVAMDIEAKSLKLTEAGIYSIGFATGQYSGIAFMVKDDEAIKGYLKDFFRDFNGRLIVHNASYDIQILVYELYMERDFTELRSQMLGLNHLFYNLDDTMIMAYLCTNNVNKNELGLKKLAKHFLGDWAVDVKDVEKVNEQDLLTYNLKDCMATWHLWANLSQVLVQEEQDKLYKDKFLPYLKDCVRMQLNGFSMNQKKIAKLDNDLNQEKEDLLNEIRDLDPIKKAEMLMAIKNRDKRNSQLKTKKLTIKDVYQDFNFNSTQFLQCLLYEVMNLPKLDKTKKGELSSSGKTLKKLMNFTDNKEYKLILKNIADYKDCEKIISSFIPAFKNLNQDKYEVKRLNGYFKLGGTVSGRMSSNSPNLQQIPSTGSRFAKIVKECFIPPNNEWLMVGIDFSALEQRLDALLTKDPNKLKVFTDGVDMHCLNAYIAFNNQMENIDFNDVNSINSIKQKYPELRQKAKAVGFALQYGGSPKTLIRNSGLNPHLAEEVFKNYHLAYSQSVKWKEQHLNFARKNGYVKGAFGLKIRCPLLRQRYNKDKVIPFLIEKQQRTIANALVQGWGLLNNRALRHIIMRIDNNGYFEDIYPIASIHDANYFMIKADAKLLCWFNKVVVDALSWQNDEEIFHDKVKLTGNLELYFPSWANSISIPNDISEPELVELLKQEYKK